MLTYLVFLLAERIDRILGQTGRSILTRLLGVILAALAVQFVADGIKALMAAHKPGDSMVSEITSHRRAFWAFLAEELPELNARTERGNEPRAGWLLVPGR